jgi:protein SCO1/2
MKFNHMTFPRLAFMLFPGALVAVCVMPAFAQHEGHAQHMMEGRAEAPASRSVVSVRLPAVNVRQHNGKLAKFDAVVNSGRPVLLNFVYTNCTVICLPMTQIFSATQDRLGASAGQVQMLSVSIDPARDTPAVLAEYAESFHAGKQWIFNTGSQRDIDEIQRAFNVYRPDKMSHTPVTFIRPHGSREWVRLDGFASPDQLIREAMAPVIAAP